MPNLNTTEQKDEIIAGVRDIADKLGIEDYYNFYVSRVREKLHIVLCMSPVGEALRVRIRMFPSLVNCCTIDWIDPWPEEALMSVSMKIIDQLQSIRLKKIPDIKTSLCKLSVFIHQSVTEEGETFFQLMRRHIYTTPKNYLDLLKLYKRILFKKEKEVNTRINILSTGVGKLDEANVEVTRMKGELEELKPKLKIKMEEADVLEKKLKADKLVADKSREKVEMEAQRVQETKDIAEGMRTEVNDTLERALPALKKAKEGLKHIKKEVHHYLIIKLTFPGYKRNQRIHNTPNPCKIHVRSSFAPAGSKSRRI